MGASLMNKRKDISIRKFSLFALIGLSFLIISNILVTTNLNPDNAMLWAIGSTQVLGNLLLGTGLIGYFLHLKENRLLKWTSLFVGIFYILNLMAPDSIMPIVLEEFDGLPKNLVLVYTIVIECIMIFFGMSFMKLAKFSRAVGLFCLLFVSFSSITFVFHLINITIDYNVDLHNFLVLQNFDIKQLEYVATGCKILSYGSLLTVFIFLYVRQKNQLNTVFNIKNLDIPDPEELKQMELEQEIKN